MLSRLNHTASALAVYASPGLLPPLDARLAPTAGSALPGGILTHGFQRKVSSYIMLLFPLSQARHTRYAYRGARIIHDLLTILQNGCVVKELRLSCPKHRANQPMSQPSSPRRRGSSCYSIALRFSWFPAGGDLLFIHKSQLFFRPYITQGNALGTGLLEYRL